MPVIEKTYKDKLIIDSRDIADINNYKLSIALQDKYKVVLSEDLPIFYLNGQFLNGESDVTNKWRDFIENALRTKENVVADDAPLPTVDLISRFQSFTPLAIIGIGLIDGVNPCAFTVIVFFISFLGVQGYRKKELIIIGLCFIFSVFITYLLIGLGAFEFLYSLNKFWIITKIINYAVGIFSVLLGFFAAYDFMKYKKTGNTEGLLLQLPKGIKHQINRVIGMHYRVKGKAQKAESKKSLFALMISAFVTGFLVSLLEAVCTGQTYIPTITFILKTTSLKLQAIGYLLLYNFMFIAPLLIIFVLALIGVTSGQFSKFLKNNLLLIKILMAFLFFGLGIFLIISA